MKVILRDDMQDLGKRGDIVDVADGYARNYLLPKGKAMVATPGAVEQAAKMRRARDLRDASDREAATTVASTLVPMVFTIEARVGSEGKLFGSVTAADIADAVEAQSSVAIDRRKIEIADQIKTAGQHVVTSSLHPEVSFPITVEVVAS